MKIAHRRWRCDEESCDTTFSRKSDMKRHYENVHKERAPEDRPHCFRCDRPLKNDKTLRQHEDRCKGKMKRHCEECKQDVYNSSDLRNHRERHRKEKERDMIREGNQE